MKMFAQVFIPAGGEQVFQSSSGQVEARLYSVLSHLYVHLVGARGRLGDAAALLALWAAGLFGVALLGFLLNNLQRRYAADAPSPRYGTGFSWTCRVLGIAASALVLAPIAAAVWGMVQTAPLAGPSEAVGLEPAFRNSLVVAAASAAWAVLFGSLAAFPLACMRFPGRRIFAALFFVLAFVPAELLLPGLYETLTLLRLRDTLTGLVIAHGTVALPMCVLIAAGGFWSTSRNLTSATALEGCGPLATWYHVMLPAAHRPLTVAAWLAALGSWNDFLFALALNENPAVRTLPVALFRAFDEIGLCWPVVPLLVASLFLPAMAASLLPGYFVQGR
jgi:ABC-type glycerol-3-phosphate transport system permease component